MLKYSTSIALSSGQIEEYTCFALELAHRAGEVIVPHFREELDIEDKRSGGRFDPVTEADRAAERVVRDGITDAYPSHGILGEEFGHESGDGLTWVVDPIDGTRAFMTGMLHWGLLLALFDGEKPVLGIMHQPFTNETFYGTNDSAFYRHGDQERRLRTRACGSLDDAVLTTTSPKLFAEPKERAAFDRLEGAVKLSKYGGDCYIYAMVAMGFVDLATDCGLKAYDIQALIPIIQGAGGIVSTADGGDASMGGLVLAAGSRELHTLALKRMMEE